MPWCAEYWSSWPKSTLTSPMLLCWNGCPPKGMHGILCPVTIPVPRGPGNRAPTLCHPSPQRMDAAPLRFCGDLYHLFLGRSSQIRRKSRPTGKNPASSKQRAGPVLGRPYCAPALSNRTKAGWMQWTRTERESQHSKKKSSPVGSFSMLSARTAQRPLPGDGLSHPEQ